MWYSIAFTQLFTETWDIYGKNTFTNIKVHLYYLGLLICISNGSYSEKTEELYKIPLCHFYAFVSLIQIPFLNWVAKDTCVCKENEWLNTSNYITIWDVRKNCSIKTLNWLTAFNNLRFK